MTYSFNLIDRRWIPCVTNDGELDELNLFDLLVNAHQIRAISCETPLITAAMYPLLLTILHRIFGPSSTAQWEDLWEGGSFPQAPIENYFSQWHGRFDLFDAERPFLQADDDRVTSKSVVHLIHSIGNTGTLFTHQNDDSGLLLSPAKAARHLISAQSFRTAGLSGLSQKFTDSPFSRGVLFWADGDTLFETLLLNLLPYPSSFISIQHTDHDLPHWEYDDPFHERSYPHGYLDYLTWPSKRIRLIPPTNGQVSEMTVAPGLNLSADIHSPQKRYIQREKKGEITWSFLYFNTERSLWRDYHNLLSLDSSDVKPPTVVEWLAHLSQNEILDDSVTPKLTAIGMLADQAKPIFYREECIPIPSLMLRNSHDTRLVGRAIDRAEDTAKSLRRALDNLADCVLMRDGSQKPDPNDRKALIRQWDVLTLYWADLEPAFWEYIDLLQTNSDEAEEHWQTTLTTTARYALAEAAQMAGTSAAALRGQIEADRWLNIGLKKVFDGGN